MSLPWIQVDANLPNHRKSVHLGVLLGDRRAWTYLVQLWSWASQNEPTGLVRGAVARMVIEHAAGWTGDPDRLTAAFIEAGWLDVREDGLYLHDWHEHQGAHIEKHLRDLARKRSGKTPPSGVEPARNRRGDSVEIPRPPRDSGAPPRENSAPPRGEKEKETEKEIEKKDDNTPDSLPLVLSSEADGQVLQLQKVWNETAPEALSRWKAITKDRRIAAKARLKEHGLAQLREAILRLGRSAFLLGSGQKGWKADVDWLLRPGNAAKVLEGKYDDHGSPGTAPPVDMCREPGCERATSRFGDICETHFYEQAHGRATA
jgi:hypothetical protein